MHLVVALGVLEVAVGGLRRLEGVVLDAHQVVDDVVGGGVLAGHAGLLVLGTARGRFLPLPVSRAVNRSLAAVVSRRSTPGSRASMDTATPLSTTVVIATRDRRDQLLRTLGELTALPEQPPIILVDNGSGDGTPDAVRAAYPEVTVLEPGQNLGAVGRTFGVLEAETELVASPDDDSWWQPGALARADELFQRHPRLGLLTARTLVGPEGRLDPLSAELAGSPLGQEADLPGPSVLGFLACAAVVRRSAYLQVGGFSPVVFFFG